MDQSNLQKDNLAPMREPLSLRREPDCVHDDRFIYRFTILIIILIVAMFVIWFIISPESFVILHPSYTDANGVEHKIPNAINGMYFAMANISATGCSDIIAKSIAAKVVISMMQIFIMTVTVGMAWIFTNSKLKHLLHTRKKILANIKA